MQKKGPPHPTTFYTYPALPTGRFLQEHHYMITTIGRRETKNTVDIARGPWLHGSRRSASFSFRTLFIVWRHQ